MSTSWIKYIAIATMLIDHIGLFFFPQITILRDIGRISFPLFAWLIANGAHHTRDTHDYLRRLFIFALISQIPFTLANQFIGSPLFYLNVLFTLSLGLVAILGIKKSNNIVLQTIVVLSLALVANGIHSDYGAIGVLAVVSFYLFFKNKTALFLSHVCIFIIIPIIVNTVLKIPQPFDSIFFSIQATWYALLALPFIFLYNNKKGYSSGFLFYIVYPVQYVVIFLILLLIN